MNSNGRPHLSGSKRLHRLAAKWFRWLHIYLSLASLAIILFFSITGFTLNHPDWFFGEKIVRYEGQLNREWLTLPNATPQDWDEADYGHQVDKLQVAEFLRREHRLSGHVSDFLSFEDQCEVTFQGPGYAATARIDRPDGHYECIVTTNDFVSIMNDFHKGRHTGPVWSVVIDVSAIIATLVALTGFALIFYLKLNRTLRLSIAVIGTIATAIMMYWIA